MPPKRKASAAADKAPPTKRVTRSRGPLIQTQPIVATPDHVSRPLGTATEKHADSTEGESSAAEGEGILRTGARKGGRLSAVGKGQLQIKVAGHSGDEEPTRKKPAVIRTYQRVRRETILASEASSSKVTIEALRSTIDPEDDSPDELLLSSPPPLPARPLTPPQRTSGPLDRATPRVILDAVEILTPSRRMHRKLSPPQFSPRTTRNVVRPTPATPEKHRDITLSRTLSKAATQLQHPPSPTSAVTEDELDTLPAARPISPINKAIYNPPSSPRKGKTDNKLHTSPGKFPRALASRLHPNLHSQKRASLRALHQLSTIPDHSENGDDGSSTNEVTYQQLGALLKGTVDRGEGNSCLIIGPRGSGKTQLLERALSDLPEQPIVIRLSGHVQTNDRLAVREIAWQLSQQTGRSMLPQEEDDQLDQNPFLDTTDTADPVVSLPPPSHLLALISMIPTLSRPTVVIVDAFDLFSLHARQALLYCLLDTAQSCRVGAASKGMAVVGLTTRVDTINMLEKRVKSRFSGRMLRTAGPRALDGWIQSAKTALCTPVVEDEEHEWRRLWEGSVNKFFDEPAVVDVLRETFALSRDIRTLSRILVDSVISLKPDSPFLNPIAFAESGRLQRCPPRYGFLSSLNYPAICLLIAAIHARTSGHEAVTFEMLHETFRDQVRTSLSAPVQVEGGGIGMVRCSRDVMIKTFEVMISQRLFIALAPPTVGTAKEFVRYRCAVERHDVKKAVEKMGQLNLKKWFSRSQ